MKYTKNKFRKFEIRSAIDEQTFINKYFPKHFQNNVKT